MEMELDLSCVDVDHLDDQAMVVEAGIAEMLPPSEPIAWDIETGATETLETRDGRVAVETVLTDNDAWQLLRDSVADSNSFANTLCAKRSRYGGWTQNQRGWAHKLAMAARHG